MTTRGTRPTSSSSSAARSSTRCGAARRRRFYGTRSSSTAVVALEVGEDGAVKYDAIVKQGENKGRIVQTSLDDVKEKAGDEDAQLWVEESGEDEWKWEEDFKDAKEVRMTKADAQEAQNIAKEMQYLVETVAGSFSDWRPLRDVRPNWIWKGMDAGGWDKSDDPAASVAPA